MDKENPKNVQDEINAMPDAEMHFRLHQVQHILNALINGQALDGAGLDQTKLVGYKLAVVRAGGICRCKSPSQPPSSA